MIANAGMGLTKLGANTLTLSGSNSYTGVTNINSGTLSLANSAAIPLTSVNITFGGGTLQFSLSNTNDYSGSIVNSTSAISIDTNGQSVTFNSNLNNSNSGGLTKINSGMLTLGGSNSYGGGTTINAGTLQLGSTAALPTSTALTLTGGTLDLDTYAATVANLTSAAASNIINSGISQATLTVTGAASTTASGVIGGSGRDNLRSTTTEPAS